MTDNAVAITITSVSNEDDHRLLVGFNNGDFSQAVYLPYKGVEAADELGKQIHEALVKSAEEIRAKHFIVE